MATLSANSPSVRQREPVPQRLDVHRVVCPQHQPEHASTVVDH
jgi:hypothetical protein